MIKKICVVEDFKKLPFLFCPNCKQQILPPKFLEKSNIRTQSGLNLNCSLCKQGTCVITPSNALKGKWKQEDEMKILQEAKSS